MLNTTVQAVHRDSQHRFSKQAVPAIVLEPGLGVVDDAHHGATVQHRSRVKANPHQPNLRQVHLISADLFAHLTMQGFRVTAGQLGENITLATAHGLGWRELICLPVDTQLQFTQGPVLRLTGLRNPCVQIDNFQKGLFAAMLDKTPDGQQVRKTGVMAVVLQGGIVQAGDTVTVQLPSAPHRAMERV
ncbi:MAG: MOSC domain-containing protein [Comamonas sp.]